MRPGCRSIPALALVPLLSVVPLHAQSAPPGSNTAPTIKTNVRRVLVDVVVTNDKGDAVTGLHKEDFEILEDGKTQSVATFEEHHGAPLTLLKMPHMPPHVYTNFPLTQSADSVNVLLLDGLNTPSRDQAYVHSQMLKYLKTIPPGTRVAIFTLASRLRMLQGVTTDSSELLAVLNSSKAGPSASPLLPSNAENDSNQRIIDFMEENESGNAAAPTTLAMAEIDPISVMKQFLADTAAVQTELRIGITLQAFQQLARYLSGVPGRKNVIWFSGSFPTGIFPDQDVPDSFNVAHNFLDDIRKTTDLLTAAQVAIYPIAAEGLAADTLYEANGTEIGEKRPSLVTRDQVRQLQTGAMSRDLNHTAMEQLAKETGGQAYYNTNGLNGALARVINNGTRYYTLTYSPANTAMDGKFRHIQVKLLNGKGALAYHRGYYADDMQATLTAGLKPDADPLMPLMGRNLPDYTQILYKVLVEPVNPQPAPDAARIGSNTDMKGPFTRYGVDFAIAVDDLRLDPAPDGERHGSLEVMLIAYDREGKPQNLVVTTGNVTLNPTEYAAVQRGGLQIHKEIDVPKEYVFLRSGVYDLKSSNAGTLGSPLMSAGVSAAK
ncbi:MAG TPA: VWA domain-containing protein [Candidatus Sulfotelmatobacter sp.]|nr:VWA domain-containing protein [Candidatus Sulfotelmatobacter sp.]